MLFRSGNLVPSDARAFLRGARRLLGNNGALVLGADLRKDPGLLHAAYNDAAGVTAREIGRVGGDHVTVSVNGQVAVHTPVVEAENAWATAIEKKMHRG